MNEYAIRADALGKQYRSGNETRGYGTFRDAVSGTLRRIGGRGATAAAIPFWALRDVSFEIPRGEVTGVVGRNGAGKSTLLKILARITEPTLGKVEIRGRLGSLLEVGTGFHPELSGRENIFLNGAILGMRRAEIARKFDEIVAFAEQEAFIDTPVKRYSSGMYMRLAFAVAAHLEPDILLVDEVLAVGDAAFQKKCLGKMGDISREGRTILFVSHDVTSIAVLCKSALLMESGRVAAHGPTSSVLDRYLRADSGDCSEAAWPADACPGDDTVRLRAIRLLGANGLPSNAFSTADGIVVEMDYEVLTGGSLINPVIGVKNSRGVLIFTAANYSDPQWGNRLGEKGTFRTRCAVPGNILNDESYSVDTHLIGNMRTIHASSNEGLRFTVVDDGSLRGDYVGEWRGAVRPRCVWSSTRVDATASTPGDDR